MRKYVIITLVAFLLLSAGAAHASPVINEVVFDPSGTELDGEWVEIYNDSAAAIVMTNYVLSNQGALSYTFPAFTLNSGAYVVVHMGAGVNTVTNLYANQAAARLDNTGDDLVLQNAGALAIDYIAYGSGGAIQACPGPLSWTGDISIAGYAEGDSTALYPNGADENSGTWWIRRTGGQISQGAGNGVQPDPTVAFTNLNPTSTAACQDIRADVRITNNDSAVALYDTDVVVSLPADYYYISSSPAGTYNAGAHTVTWAVGTLAASGIQNFELHVRPACSAASGSHLSARADYRRFPSEPNPKHSTSAVNSGNITLSSPTLDLVLGEFTSGATVIWEESGQTVEYKMTVLNTGTSGTVTGVPVTFTYGAGLTLVAIKNDTSVGTSVIYTDAGNVASWTTDVIAAGGQEVFYIRCSTTACADLAATAGATWGCADDGGAPSCSLADSALVTVRCPLTFTIVETLPEGGGTYVNSCQEFTETVTLTNNDENQLDSVQAVVTIPVDYYYVSSVPAGTYNSGAHTVTFNVGSIAGFGTQALVMTLRTSCNAISMQQVMASVTYETPSQNVITPIGEHIVVRHPVVNITMEDDANPGATTILAARGDTVVFRLNVVNTGDGSLKNGADVSFTAGTGFSNILFYDSSDVLLAPQPTLSGGVYTWNSGEVAAGTTKYFKIRLLISDCVNLTNQASYTWGCADDGGAPSCTETNLSNSSITILLKTPLVSVSVPAISVAWCTGTTVTIPVTNNGTGPARNVQVNITGLDYTNLDIVTTGASNFSYVQNGAVTEFHLTSGADTDSDGTSDDIAASGSYNIVFTYSVKTGGAGCAAGGAGGGLIVQPEYVDDCDNVFTAGTALGAFAVAARPRVTIVKNGPIFASVGGTLGWSFTVTNYYTSPLTVEVVDEYPDAGDTANGWGNFVCTNPDGGTNNGDTVTFTVANGNAITIPAGGSVTKTLAFNAPTETCAGGQTYGNTATMTFTANDCNGCVILGNGSIAGASVYINNTSEEVIEDQTRIITYTNYNSNHRLVAAASGETCAVTEDGSGNVLINGGVNVSASIDFNNAVTVPNTWDNTDGSGNNISFTEHLDGGFQIPAAVNVGDSLATRLNLVVIYNGNNITSQVTVTDNGGSFTLDFGGVNEATYGTPRDGHVLSISYTLYAPAGAAGSFINHHTITVPNSGVNCTNALPEDYDWGAIATIIPSGATVGVSKRTGNASFVDKCETATFRITLGNGTPWTTYDTRVELNLNTLGAGAQYTWTSGSTVTFSGFTDETGAAVAAFDPTVVGDVLRWDFGDLNSVGYIEVELTKKCSLPGTSLAATVYTNTNCTNVTDGSSYGSNSSSGAYAAAVFRSANMEVVLTPEIYFIKDGYPTMRFYVLNSGNGTLYNAVVPLVFGTDLDYYAHTQTLPAGTNMVSNVIDDQHVTFTFDQITPGQQAYVDFTMRAQGCTNKSVEIVDATWGCAGQTTQCQASLPLDEVADVRVADSRIIVTEHSAVPSFLDYCGSIATFTIRISDSGISEVYEAIARETLPPGLVLYGTPQYRIDQNGDGTWDAPLANFPRPGGYTSYNAGTRVITWNFMDPNNDNSEADSIITTTDGHEADADGLRHMVLKPGAQIEIQFEANIPDCAEATNYYNGSRQAQAEVFFDKPCDHANMGDPLSSSSLNMVTELPSDANVDVLVQSRNPTGAPWNGAWTNSIVRGENGQTLEWKVTLTSNGDGSAPVVTLKNILPANVTYVGWSNVGAESSAGVSMNFVSGNGTAGNPLTLLLNNTNKTDDPGTTVDETTYLDDGQQVTVLITATVNSCSPVLTTNAATAEWGCCTVGGPPGSNGNNSAAVDLRTTPDGVPTISVVELPGGEFTGCLGALRMTVTNPNPDYTLYGFNVNLPVPAGYLYDSSTATLGSTFSYAGNAGRAAITLTEAEEEPNVVGATVYWRGIADAGNIPNNKAVILPGETVTITARYRTDGATICDTGSANDPVNPYDMGALADFSAAGNGSFDDSCGTVVVSPSASVSVNPEQADVDVSALSVNSTLAKGGDTIQWTFTLTNRGDATASNLAFNLNLGDGYNLMTRVSGTAENTLAGNTATWNRGTVSLAPGASQTWVYSAQVLAAGGDLRSTVTVNGYCVDLNGSDVCQYTNDQSIGYLAGAEVLKTIASVNTPASITNAPTNTTANATHGNAITYTIEARFTDDGPYTSVALTDTLPANMTYVSAVPAPDSVVGQVLTWNLGGGTINSAQTISISVIARVANAANRGDVLTNTAALSFVHHATTFNSTTHPVNLAETNSVTVIASRFRTVDLQKTAVPVGTPTPGSLVKGGDTIDYTVSARNSGNSPAYESVFVDVLPVGLRTAGLTNITVGVDTSGDRVAERNLTNGVDYNTNWVAGTGTFTVTLLSTANATIAATEALIVSYRATVDGAVGVNVILTNGARINSYTSLPSAGAANEVDRSYAATGNVVNYHHTAGPVSVGKTVANSVTPTANQATIGELVTYTLTYVVPQDSAAFDLTVSDTFPDGLTVQSAGFSYENPAGGPAITGALTITPNAGGTYSVTGTIGDVEANATTGDNTVTVTVTATVDQKYNGGTNVVRGDVFNNTGSFTWNGINDTPATTQTNSTGAAPTVTIIEPTLANLTKAVQGISTPRGTDTFYWYDGINPDPITAAGLNVVLPGDLVTYRVTVQNTDAACRAYDVVISDVIPSGMTYNSVVSVTGSIRGALALTTDYTIDTTAPNLQITVKRLDPGETLTIDYRYSVDNGLAIGRVLINSVTETDYSTLPAGNPYEALERDSTSDPAYSDLGPATAMVGVRNTSATFSVYRIFDDAGSPIAPQSVSAGEVRVGEVLRYEVEVPIWNNTAFLRGTAASSHFIFQVNLPNGISRVAGQDIYNTGTLTTALSLLGVANTGTAQHENWQWSFDNITNSDGADRTVKLVFFAVATNDYSDYNDNTLSYSLTSTSRVVWDTTSTAVERGDVADHDRPRLDPANLTYTLTQPSILTANHVWQSVNPACGANVIGNQTIDYTVRATNTGSAGATKSTAYDLVFVSNIPLELRDVAGPQIQAITSNGAALTAGVDYSTNWVQATGVYTVTLLQTAAAQLLRGQYFEITYRTIVDGLVGTDTSFTTNGYVSSYTSFPATAPAPWPNKDRIYGNTVGIGNPSYLAPLTCTHQTASPLPTKAVTMRQTLPAQDPVEVSDNSGRATIGERVTWKARLVIPQNLTVYDLTFTDTVPDGLTAISAAWAYSNDVGANVTGAFAAPVANGNGTYTVSGTIGDVPAVTIAANNTVIVRIICTVDKTFVSATGSVDADGNSRVSRGDSMGNVASFTWNRKNDDAGTSVTRNSNTGTPVYFTIVEPTLATLAKQFASGNVANGNDLYDSDGTTVRNARGTATYYYYTAGPTLQTVAGVDTVWPDDFMRFTVTFVNTGNSSAHEINMVDTLPPEMTYVSAVLGVTGPITATASDGSNPAITVNATSPNLDVTFSHLNAGATMTVTYWCQVTRLSGAGRYMRNSAVISDYSSLNDLMTDAGVPAPNTRERSSTAEAAPGLAYADLGPVTEQAGIAHATIVKNQYRLYDIDGDLLAVPVNINAAASARVRVGEIFRYDIVVTLPRYSTLFDGNDGVSPHVIYVDALPSGIRRVAGSDDYASGNLAVPVTVGPTDTGPATTETWFWRATDIVNNNNAQQTATVRFNAYVSQTNKAGTPVFTDNSTDLPALVNTARCFWDTQETSPIERGTGAVAGAIDRPYIQATRNINVQQPRLAVAKVSDQPSGTPVNAGDDVVYTVTVTNQNAATFTYGVAYDLSFQDTLPIGMRNAAPVIISVTAGGRVLTANDYTSGYNAGTGLFTLTTNYDAIAGNYDARIAGAESLVINYRAWVDLGVGAGTLINSAQVNQYWSLPTAQPTSGTGRKSYGPHGPAWVVLQTEASHILKSAVPVPGSYVAIGDTITYTLVIPNPSITANMYDVELTDVLPDGLEVVTPATDITVAGGVGTAIAWAGARNEQITITATSIPSSTQVTVTIIARVTGTFNAGGAIPFYHVFENFGTVYYYNAAVAPRTRYSAVSNRVTHVFRPTGILLEPDHTENGAPGAVKIYRHILRNIATTPDNVTITFGPSTRAWEWMLYLGDGGGNITGSPITSGSTVNVAAGTTQELILKAFIPQNTPAFTQDVIVITATGATNTVFNTDTTVVQEGRVTIFKEVSTDGVNYVTEANVNVGTEVYQRLTVYVNGDEGVMSVFIMDPIPENTVYVRNSSTDDNAVAPAVNDPELKVSYSTNGGTAWTDGEPASDPVAAQVTNLGWEYVGNAPTFVLEPGKIKQVVFKVRIK